MSLFRKVQGALRRDAALEPSELAAKVASNVHAIACAAIYLRPCDRVGARPRSFGRPRIDNQGSIVIGDDFALGCAFGTALLSTSKGGALEIGDHVTINYGTSLTAHRSVRLGSRVMIGPYCVISDCDAPAPFAGAADVARPVEIGDDVWLAARVIVRPGARIGSGAVIAAGSVVEGEIPKNAVASGAPAKVLRVRGAVPSSPNSVATSLAEIADGPASQDSRRGPRG